MSEEPQTSDGTEIAASHRVTIEYCPRCGWLLRAAWLAQELLTTFHGRLREVGLRPAGKAVFRICVDDAQVWSRVQDGGFPAAAELKRRVRDIVAPGLDLGHTEQSGG